MKLTLAELREAADRYFHRRLAGEEWKAFNEEAKQSALTEAEADVALYLDCVEVDPGDARALDALFEQAVHLARRARRRPHGRRLVSEEVSGVGRRSWEYPEEKDAPDYAPRAVRIMDALRRRGFRFGRG